MTPTVVRAPTVAAITLHPTGGGIAVVSSLIWRVFQQQWDSRATLITMFSHENRPTTLLEKATFTLRVTGAEAFGQTDWILFSHLALAQVQHAVPRRLRCRYGIFLHGIEAWKSLSGREQRVLSGADLRVANSEYTARRVMDVLPNIGRVEACPLALEPEMAQGPPDGASLPPLGRHAVLVVGRMLGSERYKGHDQLIEAWPMVVARVPDAQLVIAGSGDDLDRLKRCAAGSPAASSIMFTGFVSRSALNVLYDRSALFALPSRGEGFGLVYLEAMTRRLPCVGSIHDAASEVIVDGVTGCLVDQDNVKGIADTLAELLLDEPRRHRMGQEGYRRAMTDFSFDRFSCRLRELLAAAESGQIRTPA